MKTAKKALALLLVVALCMGLFATMAFADQTYTDFESKRPATIFNVVSIGSDIDGQNDYPYSATKQLQNLYGVGADFRLQVLSQPGLGAAELRAILTRGVSLDDASKFTRDNVAKYVEAYMDANPGKYENEAEALKALGDSYVKTIRGSSVNEEALKEIRDAYLLGYDVENDESLLYASFITLDVINNSITPYLSTRLMAIVQNYLKYKSGDLPKGEPIDPYWEDTPAKVHDEAVTGSYRMMTLLLNNTYTELFEAAGIDPEEDGALIEALTNALTYSAFSFYADFRQVVKYIITANPLAKLVIMGPYNDLAGLEVLVNDDPKSRISVAFGEFWDSYLAVLGAVICNDENSGYYYYADCMTNRDVETCYNDLVEQAALAAAASTKTNVVLTNMSEVDDAYVTALKEDAATMMKDSLGYVPGFYTTFHNFAASLGLSDDQALGMMANIADITTKYEAATTEYAKLKSNCDAKKTVNGHKGDDAAALADLRDGYQYNSEKKMSDAQNEQAKIAIAYLEAKVDYDNSRALFNAFVAPQIKDVAEAEKPNVINQVLVNYGQLFTALSVVADMFGEAAKYPVIGMDALTGGMDMSALGSGLNATVQRLAILRATEPAEYKAAIAEAGKGMAVPLNLYARLLAADGYGLTPSEDGVTAQTEAMFEACAEIAPANTKGEDATTGIFSGLFGGALKSFQVPILETINQVFNDMFANVGNWLSNFFANIRNGLSGVFNFGK